MDNPNPSGRERKVFFVLWMILIGGCLIWFLISKRPSAENQVRSAGVSALRDISNKDAEHLCDKITPALVNRVQQMKFSELNAISAQLPEKVFCIQAARMVFELYGDYYVDQGSIRNMATSRVVVKGDKATLYFDDGAESNTSYWVKRGDNWMIDDGILELVDRVAHRRPHTAQPEDKISPPRQ